MIGEKRRVLTAWNDCLDGLMERVKLADSA